MTGNITNIVLFFTNTTGDIFTALDSNSIEGFSILDMLLAIWFFQILVWFVLKVLTTQERNEEKK